MRGFALGRVLRQHSGVRRRIRNDTTKNREMNSRIEQIGAALFVLVALAAPGGSLFAGEPGPAAAPKPAAASAKDVGRGRYIAIIGGCNDCHTAGYAPADGKVPESQWLKGDPGLGFRGPWGTTYASNLRIVAASMTENDWVKFARELKTRPPMPWFTLNQMTSSDLRALYRFIRQLGPPGEKVTAFVPPDKEPEGPVLQWPAPPK
jgi:mono/diheme cytochrome c family protein